MIALKRVASGVMVDETKIKNTWDECKTKEEKEAFIKDLDRIDKTANFMPFDEYILKQKENNKIKPCKEDIRMKNKTKRIIFGILLVIGFILVFMYVVYIANPRMVLPIFAPLFILLAVLAILMYALNKLKIMEFKF